MNEEANKFMKREFERNKKAVEQIGQRFTYANTKILTLAKIN